MPSPPRRYLDHAATSFPKPEGVAGAVDRYLREIGVATGRGTHGRAVAASRIVEGCRGKLARLLAVDDPSRIVFALNATDALHLAFRGIAPKRGERVVSTVMEHNSVLRPLRGMEERDGVEVVRVEADREGVVSIDGIREALKPGARLLAIQHASNVTGAIQPVAEAAALAHAAGALVLVDAAQTMGTREVSPAALGADLVACSGHKGLLGPLGTGVLWVAPHVDLLPVREGGTGSRSEEDRQPDGWPDHLESGSNNAPGIAGLGAAVDFIESFAHGSGRGVAAIREHKEALAARFLDGATAIEGLEVLGPRDPTRREAVFSLRFAALDAHEAAILLDTEFGIEVRAGLHCAPLAHQAIGTFPTGSVRASFGVTTTNEDVDALLEALRALAGAV